MAETDYLVVLITTSSCEEGRKIADALVTQRKAACVNIVPGVRSLFRWKGKMEEAEESLLLVKTRAALFPEVASLVRSMHSYEVPEIIALPVVQGDAAYLTWVGEETSKL